MNNNKKGFSLIELSIVLIIIGLLVAGITGGASLIKSAELRSVMSEIRNYQTALNAYYTATGELPGTSGSSQMTFVNSCSAWAALASEGIVDTKLSSFSTATGGKYTCAALGSTATFTTSNSITSKLKGGLYALGYNTDMGENVIFIAATGDTPAKLTAAVAPDSAGTGGTAVTNASITRKDAQFLDDKMDNGVIDSGKIYSFSAGSGACAYGSTSESTKDCATAISFGL